MSNISCHATHSATHCYALQHTAFDVNIMIKYAMVYSHTTKAEGAETRMSAAMPCLYLSQR